MAAKRLATSDLNHTNWDCEEEPEEAGTFKKASEDKLKNRVIKTAKRRNPISSDSKGDGDKKNAFGGFSGFVKPATTTSNTFSFLSNLGGKNEPPKTNGLGSEAKPSTSAENTFNPPENKLAKMNDDDKSDKSNEYYAKLKGLNESVSQWIKKHVDANPLINLQPIFHDYEKYLSELDELEKSKSHTTNSVFKFSPMSTEKPKTFTAVNKNSLETSKLTPIVSTISSAAASSAPSFSFKTNPSAPSTSTNSPGYTFDANTSEANSPMFSFGKPATSTTATASTSLFTFGSKTTTSTSAGFSFGTSSSKPFSFGNATSAPNALETTKQNEDEEDEPPKVEFTPVVEKDHVYTTRCKVFVKKDGNFSDRGVGNLYVKPVPDSEKTQLIVRADTNLGNLLLNFILSKGVPLQKMGKKDVMTVCLPTPDAKPPPTPILLRVKSPEEADTLLEILKKYQK